jgi:prophage DNA circulation protein
MCAFPAAVSTYKMHFSIIFFELTQMPAPSPAASTLEQTIGAATTQFGILIQAAANDATAIFRVISGLTDGNDYGRYFAAEDPLTPYIASATNVSAMQAQGATLRAAVAVAIAQAETDADGNLTVYPADILAVTEALRSACANPADAIRLLSSLISFAVTTPFDGPSPVSNEAAAIAQTIYFAVGAGHMGQPLAAWPTWFGDPFVLQFAQLTSAAAVLMRRAAAISLARASATYVPTSYQDAQRVLGVVDGALWMVIEEAGDIFDDASYNALRALRAAVQADLGARGSNLAQVVMRAFGAQQSALVLAYRLYQDASRADDLIARNDPPHPGFMPVSVEALAA